MSTPSRKKRKLNAIEEKEDNISMAEMILNSTIDDIFGTISMSTSHLYELSTKLQILQNEAEKRFMSSISFDKISDVQTRRERLEKMVKCDKAFINNDDIEGNNYLHVTSFGRFRIGPNQANVEFNCCIGDQEGDTHGDIMFGDLWKIDLDHNKVTVNLDEIKQFVEETGCKGIGVRCDDTNTNKKAQDYGYYRFIYDLSKICLNLMERKADEGGGWHGDVEDFFGYMSEYSDDDDIDDGTIWSILKSGDK
eukprot:158781_1